MCLWVCKRRVGPEHVPFAHLGRRVEKVQGNLAGATLFYMKTKRLLGDYEARQKLARARGVQVR